MIEAEQRLAGLLATEREDKGDELATTLHELDAWTAVAVSEDVD
jgi:hypothetical protein